MTLDARCCPHCTQHIALMEQFIEQVKLLRRDIDVVLHTQVDALKKLKWYQDHPVETGKPAKGGWSKR